MKTLKEYNSSWYMTTKAGALYRKICGQLTTLYDTLRDYKLTGCSLSKYVNSIDRSISTGSESTRYWSLDSIFDDFDFEDAESFIDIGCGKGRVLAYVKSKGFKGNIYGIEHNPDVAEYAQAWAEKKENITVLSGDAFDLNCDDYSIIYFNRPFTENVFNNFVAKIENEVTHKIRVICYVDNYMAKSLKDRTGWTMQKQEILFKKGTIAYSYYPLRYSIWEYNK